MSSTQTKQLPISIEKAQKRETRSQFGALCYRVKDDKLQFLLITSRRTKRWIIPKGWPEDAMTPADVAALEAFEEAGVKGKVSDQCLGVFSYEKYVSANTSYPCVVMVYGVQVKKKFGKYPESAMRKRKWFSQKGAAKRVAEPDLAALIKSFRVKL
ncbi:MAG: NUDIX hydrolase [Planktomarina sp.]